MMAIEEKERILDEIGFSFLHPHKVAGMGEPRAMRLEATQAVLKEVGIGAILTLTGDDPYGKKHKAAGFLHHHEPINDCQAPTIQGMDRAVGFIGACLQQGEGVAVHCHEGRGRAGTVLCAWIGLAESLSPEEAIVRIHELRPRTLLAPPQRSFLVHYLSQA
jgi:atypical dual specificity phosphatase